MKKGIAILISACLMITLLVGCGNNSAKTAAQPDGASTEGGTKTVTLDGKDPYSEDIKIAFIPMSASGLNMAVNQQAIDDFVAAWKPYGGHVTRLCQRYKYAGLSCQ